MPTTNVPINIAGIDAAVSIWTPTGNSPSLSWISFFPLKFEFVFFKALHFCEFLLFFLFYTQRDQIQPVSQGMIFIKD